MHFIAQKLVDASAKCIEVSMTNIEMELGHLAGTVHEMPFVPAVIPNKMRPRGTRFYGGAVLVVRTTGVGMIAEERAEGRYAEYVQGRGWIKHAARHIIFMMLIAIVGKY